MAASLPGWIQPFLTWLTAKPAPGEAAPQRSAQGFVARALLWMLGGTALSYAVLLAGTPWLWLLLPLGLLATSCGLGLFQVVVFHHCSHGTVFRTREMNQRVGRLISALLLFKRFEDYQREHMLHHSPRKLLTEEDEFADFVLGMCGLEPNLPKAELWRRVLTNCASPVFHWQFARRRVKASLMTGDRAHNWTGRLAWGAAIAAAAATGTLGEFLLAWVLPVTVLLQIATVGRILCEHRFPEAEVLAVRDRTFVCHATAGVFPGSAPPAVTADTLAGLLAWARWWADMLTVQLFVRLFVLVGDAPCHDFHHRKPATRKWADYIHARQADLEAGSPGFPLGYFETWGLFQAIDQNLGTLAMTAPESIGR
ncbi:fatty acid desaturase [Siccirubricoccus sp. KC 17139]|uniref:Fatty acid desaturase n=1 Tax=Siccirubricoccus soli TaxID=2899147 RepID=A0ABT1DDN2_9PROT|nr:fatty acid desaturase [Siccirubricoccus soli]MCO6419055.1 fatty acid desaturase [Siccirubricoccus soli]MCP2685190.1 fatty acid desaturase [Siccirubricoccus soli]